MRRCRCSEHRLNHLASHTQSRIDVIIHRALRNRNPSSSRWSRARLSARRLLGIIFGVQFEEIIIVQAGLICSVHGKIASGHRSRHRSGNSGRRRRATTG